MNSKILLQRRLVLLLSLITFGLVALLGRLFYIQVWARHDLHGRDLVEAAVAQRRETFEIDSGRGDILDRNGESLTGSRLRGVLVMPLWQGEIDPAKVDELASILQANPEEVQTALRNINRPTLLRLPSANGKPQIVELTEQQAERIDRLQFPGVYAKQVKVRYDEHSLARHVIGFIGQDPDLVRNAFGGKYALDEKVGKLGLEFLFQEDLRGLGRGKTISYFTDAEGRPVNGLGIRMTDEENRALSVKTTLHRNVQKAVEAAMDKYGLQKGAVVVLDAKTEDILAMASRPQYDQNALVKQAEYPVNRAIQANFPGSVFKTVIAAAALEKGVVHAGDVYTCPGYLEIGEGRLNCWTEHGRITAEQGFAQSCNVVFASLAMKLGRPAIEEYAKKLGLGQPATDPVDGKPQFDREDPGRIFAKNETSWRLLANTGIGQEDVRISPLQAAHLMAVIANNGKAGKPRLVQELVTSSDGMLYKSFPPGEKRMALEPATVNELKRWMTQVVASPKGTAHSLSSVKVSVAGKTGTAQTGQPNAYHHWFAGYAPADQPKYAIAVLAEDVTDGAGSQLVQSVAKEIVDRLF
ncbi:peptidoglycan D,D-transpeptidase FtsI family protein [Effusibacillus pohliae]|uniref:peptidoglycan D,D-transpeptidase FtsI family protein n=1 Tax=Effusibacillus pohliae TaxID=232270 RepID=UPI00037FFEAD|nr:penicillin-binding protein 2 [Effusibacillus pohliae]